MRREKVVCAEEGVVSAILVVAFVGECLRYCVLMQFPQVRDER